MQREFLSPLGHMRSPLVADFSRSYPAVTIDLGLNRVIDLIEKGWDSTVPIGRRARTSLFDCSIFIL
jgi:hypothetical protein